MAGLLVFLTAFAVFAWTASPAIGWFDSPEFVAASVSLGVPHSPGHPLPTLLGRLAALVPVGDLPLRVSLASSAAAAAAATAAWIAADGLGRRIAPSLPRPVVAVGAAGAALAFALSPAVWDQAVRAEVYALEAALVAGGVAAVLAHDHAPRPAPLVTAGLLFGLALANHHAIAAVALAPAAALALARPRKGRPGARTAGATAAAGVLGLATLAYLPVRAAAHPLVNWGAPLNLERLWWTVSARAFRGAASADHASTAGEDAAQVVAAVAGHASPILTALAAIGVYAGLRGGLGRAASALAAIAALAVAARVVLGFDPGTPDHHGYLVPAVLAVCLLGWLGVAAAAEVAVRAGARPRAAGAGAAAVAVAAAALHGASAPAETGRGSGAVARWELGALPPRALAISSYFQTRFRLWALRAVENARPDVHVLDRSFLTYPGWADEAARRHPALAPLIRSPLRAGEPTPTGALARIARERPVRVQLHPNLDARPYPQLVPAGAFARFVAQPPTPEERARAEREDRRARARLTRALGDSRRGRETLLWHDATRLSFYCAIGRREAAAAALRDALAIAPGDRRLAATARACGLPLTPPETTVPEPAPAQ